MEIQDLNRLTEESETFTPLKVQSFQIAEDPEEADFLQKIPHGLTAKKNRRKSFHPENANRDEFLHSPQRIPLTAPRPNALNSRPINFSPMNQAKKSLISQLRSVDSGKENTTPSKLNFEIHKTQSPAALLQSITPSSPEISHNKRRSLSDEPEISRKVQKLNGIGSTDIQKDDDLILVSNNDSQFAESEDTKHDSGDDSDAEQEELSRIEAFDNVDAGSEIIPTQADEVQADQLQLAKIEIDEVEEEKPQVSKVQVDAKTGTPFTPSRLTEPVAISPKTEQCSRLVDESGLLLDTSKSPFLDENMAGPESPLSQHNNSTTEPSHSKNILESLEDFDDLSEDVALEHSARVSTPKSRPFFTISQVHEIQDDFRKETAKLEENIKEKANKILQLNDELGASKNKLYQLENVIDNLALQRMQMVKENELLKKEFEVFKNDISDMQLALNHRDEKLSRHQLVITKFKQRVKELNYSIGEKEREIEALENAQGNQYKLEESFKERSDQYEKQIHHNAVLLEEEIKARKSILEQVAVIEKENEALKAEVENINNEKISMEQQLLRAEQVSKEKDEEISLLNKKFQSEGLNLQEVQNEKNSLVNKINSLLNDQQVLQDQLNQKDFIIQTSQMNLENERKQALLKDEIINGTKRGVTTLQREILELRAINQQNAPVLQKLTGELDEANELLTVRKAEVEELSYELKQSKADYYHLQAVSDEKQYSIGKLNDALKQTAEALEAKIERIKELDEEIQKQEGEHLAELEAFHKEMSNVQSSLSAKSNELFHLKNERDTLQREYDMVKYELSSLREESSNSDVRVSNLKLKLNESKDQYQELEELVHKLKNEKASFEKDTEKRLQQLAEDLYIQYSKKHEQKVQVLKKNYESKWQNKVNKAENENERLRREIEGLNSQLDRERVEKNEIIKLWDQQREEQGNGLEN